MRGNGAGGLIEPFRSGTAMTALLASCGLIQSTALPLTGGVVTLYQAVR